MTINVHAYAAQIADLYRRQLEAGDSVYLKAHSATRGAILRQVAAAAVFLPHVRGRVLDWGCRHGVDACLVRMHLGPEAEIHGCDLPRPGVYPVFHDFARLQYSQVRPTGPIPYPDNYFDTVIADGVLEHVANDYEALKELHRILQRDGLLVISCLPNRYSYLECLGLQLRLPHHLRTYTMGTIRSMLLHSGFVPSCQRYLQMTPTLSGVEVLASRPWLRRLSSLMWSCNGLLESIWPINRLASNLLVMAHKRLVISWSRPCAA
jgi:SAM-dependent methyltransferase